MSLTQSGIEQTAQKTLKQGLKTVISNYQMLFLTPLHFLDPSEFFPTGWHLYIIKHLLLISFDSLSSQLRFWEKEVVLERKKPVNLARGSFLSQGIKKCLMLYVCWSHQKE